MVETKTMLWKMSEMKVRELVQLWSVIFLRNVGLEGCGEMGRKLKLRSHGCEELVQEKAP